MSTPDVRVRLTAEGVKDVVNALKKVTRESDRVSSRAAGGVRSLTASLGGLRRIAGTLGLTLSAVGLVAFGRSALKAASDLLEASQKIGTTTETLSVLNFAASTAGASQETLGAGASRLAKNLGELQQGTDKAVHAFGRLELTQKDLAGLDTGQAFALIAERLAKLPDGLNKTQIALALFGRGGAALIPLLNDLGIKGFAAVAAEAERLGLVVDTQTAAAADAAADAFSLMGQQAQGLANRFLAGLAPSIVDAMGTFTDATAGSGVDAMRTLGEKTGQVLRAIIGLFRLFGGAVGTILDIIGSDMAALAAAVAAAFRGEFRAAFSILNQAGEDGTRKLREGFVELFENFDRLVADVNRKPPEIKVKLRPQTDEDLTGDAGIGPEAQRKLDAINERIKRENERRAQREAQLLEERARKEEAALREMAEIEKETLEATGRGRDAQLAALDEEIRRRRQVLDEAGKLNEQTLAALENLRNVKTAEINFEDITAQGQRAFDELARARTRIEQDVEIGIQTELGGQQRILEIEEARLPVLQQLAAAALAAAQASANPELIAQAQALDLQVRQLAVSVRVAGDEWARFKDQAQAAATDELTNFLADGIENADSLADAFQEMALSIVQSLQRVAAEIIATKIIQAIAGGFGGAATGGRVTSAGFKAAGGGLIYGPGGPMSDRIPAMLSPGEYVVRARAVAQPGMLDTLRAINGMRAQPISRGAPVHMAEGGEVAAAPQTSAKIEGGLMVGLGPGLVAKELLSPDSTRSLLKVVQKNPQAFRAALGV